MKPNLTYFEFGSGGSTNLASYYKLKVYSVESDALWHNKLKQNNINATYITIDLKANLWGYPGKDTTVKDWKKYFQAYQSKYKADIIFIDGRFRIICGLDIFSKIRNDTLVLVHDYNRDDYHILEKYYIKVGEWGSLCAFFKNPNITSIIYPKKNIQNNKNYNVTKSIKKSLYNVLYRFSKKNLIYIDSLYIRGIMRYGNYLISLNNAIIFCELFNCKRIVIEKNKNIIINHPIFYLKYNLTIEANQIFNYLNYNSIILNLKFFFYLNFSLLGNVDRFYLFRNEIMKYLPKVKLHSYDLFIYIRGGDIFKTFNKSHKDYQQPPLCFYESVLNNFTFRKIRIISEDKFNPVILFLLKEYPYIKYNKNNIKIDISYLINSYNIISAVSSFLTTINKFNHNLKFLWEYDFIKARVRYFHLHYSVYTFFYNYKIYIMNASENYKKIMNPFINSERQRKMMIEEKCDKNFYLIPPRIS